jgi:hypothetical protein
MRFTLQSPYAWQAPARAAPAPASSTPAVRPPPPETIVVDGRRLPKPTEGDVIPGYRIWWIASKPADYRVDQRHVDRLWADAHRLESDLPNRSGSSALAGGLNDVARFFPRMWMWLALGALALVVRRPRGVWPVLAVALLGLAVVLATLVGLAPALEYRLPFDPAFVLFGIAALTAASRHGRAAPG